MYELHTGFPKISNLKWHFFFILFPLLFICPYSFGDKVHTNANVDSLKKITHSWEYGFKLLYRGELSNGLKILDTLCIENKDDPAVLSTYTKKIFQALTAGKKKDSLIYLNENGISESVLDTLFPSSCKWKVVNGSNEPDAQLPSFGFNAVYSIKKPFLLKFNGLRSTERPQLKINHEIIYTTLDEYMQEQFFYRDDSISCSIYIDLKKPKQKVDDYIMDYIFGVYDSVAIKKDLKKYNALSLRCYKRRSYSFEDGKFTAIIAFDRFFADRKNGKKYPENISRLPARYTVVVQSPSCVQEIAEARLQMILKTL